MSTDLTSLKKSIASARSDSTSYLADTVLAQLHHSLGGETIEAVVADLKLTTKRQLSGKVVLFGQRLLLVGDIKDAPYGAGAQGASAPDWSVACSVLPRSALRRIEVLTPQQSQPPVGGWFVFDYEHLAAGTSVLLHYDGMETPIEVTSRSTADLEALLTLVRPDMGRI